MFSPVESVRRLSWLGFRFIPGILGLMKTGDGGSDTRFEVSGLLKGGCIDKPFIFLFLGDGEVIGLSRLLRSFTDKLFSVDGKRPIVDDRPPKLVAGNEFRGIKLTGESGDDEGEGSESEEVSVVKVVVGEESADSEF